jgi:hypothetical protein
MLTSRRRVSKLDSDPLFLDAIDEFGFLERPYICAANQFVVGICTAVAYNDAPAILLMDFNF